MRHAELPTLKATEVGREFIPPFDAALCEFDVTTADWVHVCSARFGEARTSRVGKWTGDSYRYDIFRREGHLAMRWWNGGGEGWFIMRDSSHRGTTVLLLAIANNPNEAERWDGCHFLYEVASRSAFAAKRSEYRRMATAFTEGRLKKRKVRGMYEVSVET